MINTYRPDIDGLRAIAVISVILFHANTDWLPSGFLGVDVFFVISGFLITGIIQREMQNGSFSLLNFYQRRAKRILPVFLLVLLCALGAASYVMLPTDFAETLKSARYALMFAANIYFGRQGGYFDTAAAEKPLQHIWSLSVEEQFYFVFPLLLLFLFHRWRHLPTAKIRPLLLVLMCISMASFLYPYEKYDAYFLPWTRAFELLMGAYFAFAISPAPNQLAKQPIISPSLAAMVLLFGLVIPPEWLPEETILPRMLICWATGYLLSSGGFKALWVHRVLSLKPLVQIGLWSYSLYLWHWVILALLRYVYMRHDLPLDALAIGLILTFVLAYLSYRFVEQPARKMVFSQKRFGAIMAGYAVLMVGVLSVQSLYRHGVLLPYEAAKHSAQINWYPDGSICHSGQTANCLRGDTTKIPTVLAMGDSHMAQYNAFIDVVGKHEGWAAHVVSVGSCPVQYGLSNEGIQGYESAAACRAYRDNLAQLIEPYPIILLAQRWSHYEIPFPDDIQASYVPEPDFWRHFENTLQWLLAQGKQVYIMKDNPNIGHTSQLRHSHLIQRGFNHAQVNQNNIALTEAANQKIQTLVARYPQVHWVDIDFARYLPAGNQHNGLPLYKDDDHFNPYGAHFLAEKFIEDGQRLLTP